jgi:subtilase family serine protease
MSFRTASAIGAALTALLVPTALFAVQADAAPAVTIVSHRTSRVCSQPAPGEAGCLAVRRDGIDQTGKVVTRRAPASLPSGYGPADIRSAYKLPAPTSAVPTGPTVAIVDAYDAPTAEQDLGVYRAKYGLPPCTTANKCFSKVNQTGGSALPAADGGWAQEISLDLDMVSAACPACKIVLVEATSPSFSNLGIAVNTGARLGAKAISNSYGGGDFKAFSAYDHPGIAVVASTGDSGYGVQSPASFPGVVAVGGTSLKRSSTTRGWTETAWSGAGSGCSTLNAKPAWQTSVTACSKKANADVSAVADPSTGVAVYDSYAFQGASGWMVFGGTSASSPIIGGVYALSGNTAGYPASYTWAHRSNLFDVTSGSNGSCPTTIWCQARTGWDGPTGLGTPNGTAGF